MAVAHDAVRVLESASGKALARSFTLSKFHGASIGMGRYDWELVGEALARFGMLC